MDCYKIANLFAFFAILQRFKPFFRVLILEVAQSIPSIRFRARRMHIYFTRYKRRVGAEKSRIKIRALKHPTSKGFKAEFLKA